MDTHQPRRRCNVRLYFNTERSHYYTTMRQRIRWRWAWILAYKKERALDWRQPTVFSQYTTRQLHKLRPTMTARCYQPIRTSRHHGPPSLFAFPLGSLGVTIISLRTLSGLLLFICHSCGCLSILQDSTETIECWLFNNLKFIIKNMFPSLFPLITVILNSRLKGSSGRGIVETLPPKWKDAFRSGIQARMAGRTHLEAMGPLTFLLSPHFFFLQSRYPSCKAS
jgi:hypothetical protein